MAVISELECFEVIVTEGPNDYCCPDPDDGDMFGKKVLYIRFGQYRREVFDVNERGLVRRLMSYGEARDTFKRPVYKTLIENIHQCLMRMCPGIKEGTRVRVKCDLPEGHRYLRLLGAKLIYFTYYDDFSRFSAVSFTPA